jgi:hypothetical protein
MGNTGSTANLNDQYESNNEQANLRAWLRLTLPVKILQKSILKDVTSELNEDSVSQVQVYEGMHLSFPHISYTIIGI